MNKYIAIFLLLFCFYSIRAQINIRVVNENSKYLPYAHISSLDNSKFFIANENGEFYIKDDILKKTFIVTHIGYISDTVSGQDIIQHRQIVLKEAFVEIPSVEVVASKKKKITKTFGNKSVIFNSRFICPNGKEIAVRIPGQTNHSYLRSAMFFIDKEGIPNSPFGLRVYSVDLKTNKPGNLLINKDVILAAKQGNEWVKYEFKKPLEIPKSGLFITMEWLPNSERYLEEKTGRGDVTIVANGQVLKATISIKNKWKNKVYTRWFPTKEWTKVYKTIPAIKCEVIQYK